jgi:hypothetical protein
MTDYLKEHPINITTATQILNLHKKKQVQLGALTVIILEKLKLMQHATKGGNTANMIVHDNEEVNAEYYLRDTVNKCSSRALVTLNQAKISFSEISLLSIHLLNVLALATMASHSITLITSIFN